MHGTCLGSESGSLDRLPGNEGKMNSLVFLDFLTLVKSADEKALHRKASFSLTPLSFQKQTLLNAQKFPILGRHLHSSVVWRNTLSNWLFIKYSISLEF